MSIYPNGTPAVGITESDIWQDGIDFTPEIVVSAIIDDYTPINRAGIRNSLGKEIALIQNFCNVTNLARPSTPIASGYVSHVGVNTLAGLDEDAIAFDAIISGNPDLDISARNLTISGVDITGVTSDDIIFTITDDFNVDSNDIKFTTNDDFRCIVGDDFLIEAVGDSNISGFTVNLESTNDINLESDVDMNITALDDIVLTAVENVRLDAGDFLRFEAGIYATFDCPVRLVTVSGIAGEIFLDDNTTVSGTLDVTGVSTLTGQVNLSDIYGQFGAINIWDPASFYSSATFFSGTQFIGASQFDNTISVEKIIKPGSNFYLPGSTTVSGLLTVTGSSSFQGIVNLDTLSALTSAITVSSQTDFYGATNFYANSVFNSPVTMFNSLDVQAVSTNEYVTLATDGPVNISTLSNNQLRLTCSGTGTATLESDSGAVQILASTSASLYCDDTSSDQAVWVYAKPTGTGAVKIGHPSNGRIIMPGLPGPTPATTGEIYVDASNTLKIVP